MDDSNDDDDDDDDDMMKMKKAGHRQRGSQWCRPAAYGSAYGSEAVHVEAGHGIGDMWCPSAIRAEKDKKNLEAWPNGAIIPNAKRWKKGQREQRELREIHAGDEDIRRVP